VTGPEHFAAAERYLAAGRDADPTWSDDGHQSVLMAAAQAHATLALAAATALMFAPDLVSREPSSPGSSWRQLLQGTDTAEPDESGS